MSLEQIEDALKAATAEQANETGKSSEGQQKPEAKPAEQAAKEGEQGKHKEAPPEDDPEVDLGDLGKVKRSEVKKWKDGHLMQSDYTKKTQELAKEREKFKEMDNFINHLKANPKKAERIIAILDEKEEAIEKKVEAIDDELDGLPADDPVAKALRNQKKELEALKQQNADLIKSVEGQKKKEQEIDQQKALSDAQQFLTKKLEDTIATLNFADDEEKKDWKERVLGFLVRNPKQYQSEEEFANDLKEVGARAYAAITGLKEKAVKDYLSKKQGAVPATPGGSGGAPLSQKPTSDNLQDILEQELEKTRG